MKKIIFFALILLSSLGYSINWWNNSFTYNNLCNITYIVLDSSLENPVGFCEINTSALIAAGQMNSSCKDLRAIDVTNTTELLFAIENETCNYAGGLTTVWIGLNVSGDGNDAVFLYYGNMSVESTQNPRLLWNRANYSTVIQFTENGTLVNIAGGLNLTSSNTSACYVTFSNGTRGMGGSIKNCYWNNTAAIAGMYPIGQSDSTETVWYKHTANAGTVPAIYMYGAYAAYQIRGLSYYPGGTALRYETYNIFAKYDSWTFPTNTFQHYATRWQGNNDTAYIFVNGSIIAQGTYTTISTTDTKELIIGNGVGIKANWGTLVGQIDEYRIRDVASSDDWIMFEYSQSYQLGPQVNNTEAPINYTTFISQNPPNITTLNLFAYGGVNITFNSTETGGEVNLNYTVNSTARDNLIFENGTALSTIHIVENYTLLDGINYSFFLTDNQVYPATYNYNQTRMINYSKSAYSLDQNNEWISIEIINISNFTGQNYFEIYAENQTGSSLSLRMYYCNSSYVLGNPSTDTNCAFFYDLLASEPFNHTHGVNSKHHIIPFLINTTDGTLNGINVTETSYVLLRGRTAPDGWNIYYITNVSRSGAMRNTSTPSASWNNFTGTVDAHLHQFDIDDTLYYHACNVFGNCSQEYNDTFDYAPIQAIGCSVDAALVSPANGTSTINSSLNLYAQINVLNCTNATATFYLDTTNISSQLITNSSLLNVSRSMTVANHTWYVYAFGDNNESKNATSDTWNFTRLPSLNFNYINISPASVGSYNNVTCGINFTSNLTTLFNISAGLAINGVINGTYNETNQTAQNYTEWNFQKNVTGWIPGTNISCWAYANDTTFATDIVYSTNSTVYNQFIPILNNFSISPYPSIQVDTNISCTMNFTDADNSTFIVYSGLMIDGIINGTYNNTNSSYESGTDWSVSRNITGWGVGTKIGCWAYASDGYNSTSINYTSNSTVVDSTPFLELLNISPVSIGRNENVTCSINYSDIDNETFSIYSGLAINGVINDTYNITNTTYLNSSLWEYQKNITGWGVYTNISCWAYATDGLHTTSINYSTNATVENHYIPTLNNLSITPPFPAPNTNVTCLVNFTDIDDPTFSVYAGLAFNGTINTTYSETNATYSSGDYWIFQKNITGWVEGTNVSCWANATDSYNTSATNYSTNSTITVLTPVVRLLNISPINVGRNANVTCSINYSDFDNSTLSLYAGLAINGAINNTYNMTNLTYVNSSLWEFQKNITGWNFGTNISCWAFANDGVDTNISYSSNTTVTNIYIPVIQYINISPLYPNTSMNITCTMNFTDVDNSTFFVYSGLAINGVINTTYNENNLTYQSGTDWNFSKNITGWGGGTQITCWANASDGYNVTGINYSQAAVIQGGIQTLDRKFEPHQIESIGSQPYFNHKYVRHLVNNTCYIDIEPIENTTLLYVRFTVKDNFGTKFTNYVGVQNMSNPIQWYSPQFYVNLTSLRNSTNPGYGEVGWINCSVDFRDATHTLYTYSAQQYVGDSLSLASCNTSSTCNLTSGIINASGYYFYDYIELPVTQNFSIEGSSNSGTTYVYLNASVIRLFGNVSQANATNGAYLNITGYDIQTSNITLIGKNGTTAANGTAGYASGQLIFTDFDYLLTTGTITLNSGIGGSSTANTSNGTAGGNLKSVVFGGTKPGIIEWNATLNMIAGDGGNGGNGTTVCGVGGAGGSCEGSCLNFVRLNNRFNHYSGEITILAGDGGRGGAINSTGTACAAGNGGNTSVSFPYMVENKAPINVTPGLGGTGGNSNGTTAGTGGNGGLNSYSGAVNQSNSTGFSLFLNSAVIEFGAGNGGNSGTNGTAGVYNGTGGNGTCFSSFYDCNSTVVFAGRVSLASTGVLRFVNGTWGQGVANGTAPVVGDGWQYYYNSSYNETDFANLTPTATLKSSTWFVYNISGAFLTSSSAGMIRYNIIILNTTSNNTEQTSATFYNNQTGFKFIRYLGNQTLDLHGYDIGNYTVFWMAWNNQSITNISYTNFSVSEIPISLNCSSIPSSLVNLSLRKFQLVCRPINTVDNTSTYLVGIWALVTNGTNNATINLTWAIGGNYTGTNTLYYPANTTYNWSAVSVKTDYQNGSYVGGNISFKSVIVDLPTGINEVKSICVLPTQINVRPVGQTTTVGIFRIVNLGIIQQNVSIQLNQTLPTGVSQGLSNISTVNWALLTVLNTSAQQVVTGLSPFDGTQNVSNYSVYRWLMTNCSNVSIPTNATSVINYRIYNWTYIGD